VFTIGADVAHARRVYFPAISLASIHSAAIGMLIDDDDAARARDRRIP